MSAPTVFVGAASHVGRVRATNEDRVYADAERGGFAVIDGVGGQAAGELAAQTALETIRQRLQIQIGTPAERVREAIALANDHIHQQALAHPDRRGMACVLTLVLLQNGTLTAGHVGDTRLYKMRGGALRKLTHDHSPIGEREDRGELSESDAMRHPRRNEVYREVGTEPRGPDDPGFIEVVEEPFEPDAALVICSDGLSDALSGAAIAATIERHAGDPAAVVDDLIERANDASGKDNVSVVYVEGAAFARAARRPRAPGDSLPLVQGAMQREPEPSGGMLGDETPAADRTYPGAGVADRSPGTRSAAALSADTAARGGPTTSPGAGGGDRARQAAASKSGRDSQDAANAGTSGRTLAAPPARRSLSFVAGLLTGVAIALGVAYTMRDALIPSVEDPRPGPRVLTVGTSASGTGTDTSFRTIGDALADARPGDTVRVGPGEYREQLLINDGIAVIASPAREAILRAPAQALQPWTAVIVTGEQHGTRVSGLRIVGDAQAPIAIGVHVLGRTALDDLDVSGTTTAGVAFEGGAMSLSASSLHTNAGPGLMLKGGEARLIHNLFARNGTAALGTGALAPPPPSRSTTGTSAGVDIVMSDTPRVTFVGNVLGGDPAQRVRGLPPDQIARFRDTNIVLPPATHAAAPPATGPSRRPLPR